MPVSRFRGGSLKIRAKIVMVDPPTRRVDARLRDGTVIQVSVWETDAFFRWPVDGEFWTIYQDNNVWMLGARMDSGNESDPLENQSEGDIRIHAPGSILVTTGTQGYTLPKNYTQTFGDGATTNFVFTHNLNSLDVHYTIRAATVPYATVIEGTTYTVTARNPNDLHIHFLSAPATNGYVISILG